jgi:hypothetical protein
MDCGIYFYTISTFFRLTWNLQARGEAEATLSNMTTNGIPLWVDAILTDDSDSFVFGASLVLRMYVLILLYYQ